MNMERLKLYFATYNVGESTPEQNLFELLSLPEEPFDNSIHLPDIYIMSFQEVKQQSQTVLPIDPMWEDSWTNSCRKILEGWSYVKLKTIRLRGLIMSIFALRKHLFSISNIESDYTKRGLVGVMGYNGAVSIRLTFRGTSLCFINSKLTACESHLQDRIHKYNSIIKELTFHVSGHTNIFSHDYVFWMGCSNFHLLQGYSKTSEEIESIISKKDFSSLFKQDQLRFVMNKEYAFKEFKEQELKFPPTYKYIVGKDLYNLNTRPAWCDRILYQVNKHQSRANISLKAEQISYKCHPYYTLSDHKPVTAEFLIKPVPEEFKHDQVEQVTTDSELTVKFDNIMNWNSLENNEVVYRICPWKISQNNDDWIGLYAENFSSLEEYIFYRYTKDSQQTEENSYSLTFNKFPITNLGSYVLIYFSQSEDEVTSVLGISEPFQIIK